MFEACSGVPNFDQSLNTGHRAFNHFVTSVQQTPNVQWTERGAAKSIRTKCRLIPDSSPSVPAVAMDQQTEKPQHILRLRIDREAAND